MLPRAGPNGDSMTAPSVHLQNLLNIKKRICGSYVIQITKNIFRDLGGILIIVIQAINTDKWFRPAECQ